MKPIDNLIRNHLELFNTDEPPEGHFDRFYSKLESSGRSNKIRFVPIIFKVAAVLIIGLFLAVSLYKGVAMYRSTPLDDTCPNKELCEAEDFYSKQVEKYYNQIENLQFNNDPLTRKEVLKELKEMDSQVMGMKEDLKQNPNDERIIHSIINYYQVKIDLMDMIITRTTISKNNIL
ncbi:MAG: hypothetical protein JW973_05165 [Bacteroidales bacterium]|nr:hypothetical protein [Bacteroidales bacterium]